MFVRCTDGAIRHDKPFDSRAEASDWATWGHCCTSSHTFHEGDVVAQREFLMAPDREVTL